MSASGAPSAQADEPGEVGAAAEIAGTLLANLERVVLGKADVLRLVVAAFAARGHVLLEDVPGTAKTMLARALAASVEDAEAVRIQCTPDLQPTDVTGLSVWDPPPADSSSGPGRCSRTSCWSTRSTAHCRRRSRRCSRRWRRGRSPSTG